MRTGMIRQSFIVTALSLGVVTAGSFAHAAEGDFVDISNSLSESVSADPRIYEYPYEDPHADDEAALRAHEFERGRGKGASAAGSSLDAEATSDSLRRRGHDGARDTGSEDRSGLGGGNGVDQDQYYKSLHDGGVLAIGHRDPAGRCIWGRSMKVAVAMDRADPEHEKIFYHMLLSLELSGHTADLALESEDHENLISDDAFSTMASMSRGGCIEFPKNAMYNGHGDPREADRLFNSLKQRVVSEQDVDMIWAFGDVAAKALADSSLEIPILLINAPRASAAGLTGHSEYSDRPFVHAMKRRNRYIKELGMLHDIFGFKSLGVIVDSDPENQLATGLDAFVLAARQKGFELNICDGDMIDSGQSSMKREARNIVKRCAAALSLKSEAVYLTDSYRAAQDDLFDDIRILIDSGIPVFSQRGDDDVRRGALLSCADSSGESIGVFEADVVRRIFAGSAPEDVSQYYRAPFYISVNMVTAFMIGWHPGFDLIPALDRVYREIDGGNGRVFRLNDSFAGSLDLTAGRLGGRIR